jgi:hypothetical protein
MSKASRNVIDYCRIANDFKIIGDELHDSQTKIQACSMQMPTLHIFTGIEILAKELKCDVTVEFRQCTKYPIERYFIFDGVKIFELSKGDE